MTNQMSSKKTKGSSKAVFPTTLGGFFKKIILVAIAIGFAGLASSNEAVAALGEGTTHTVRVHYTECTGSTFTHARTETWYDARGNVVYMENRNCDGKTSTVGNKPLTGTGSNAWAVAVENSRLHNTSIAMALSRDYPPVDSTITVCPGGIIIGEQYRFEFPLDFVYEVANTSVAQTNNSITVTTDSPIQVQIIDLSTGLELTGLSNVYNSYTFDISNFATGCIYSIVMRQYVAEAGGVLIIRTYNFCKAPATGGN